jgi:hypothetical protein
MIGPSAAAVISCLCRSVTFSPFSIPDQAGVRAETYPLGVSLDSLAMSASIRALVGRNRRRSSESLSRGHMHARLCGKRQISVGGADGAITAAPEWAQR